MSLRRYANKRDASEQVIVSTLLQLGFSVCRMDRPVDLLVGFRGRAWLVEAKTGSKGYGKSLNASQQDFADNWRGPPIVILRDAEDAKAWGLRVAKETAHAA